MVQIGQIFLDCFLMLLSLRYFIKEVEEVCVFKEIEIMSRFCLTILESVNTAAVSPIGKQVAWTSIASFPAGASERHREAARRGLCAQPVRGPSP